MTGGGHELGRGPPRKRTPCDRGDNCRHTIAMEVNSTRRESRTGGGVLWSKRSAPLFVVHSQAGLFGERDDDA